MAQLRRSLARVSRSDSSLAVLFIDLDHFKDVNDLHGHHAGDAVLTSVARRLVSVVRDGDHVGRLGGDEFVVIAEPVRGLGETIRLGERLLEALAEPIEIDTTTVVVGASVGVALAEDDRLTADEILRDADLAVYKAKAAGRGCIELCNEDLRAKMLEEADLSIAIRSAIERDELRLQYQPIVSPVTGEIESLEALVRWQRPGHGELLQPAQFIPFAERSALIIDLDVWVLENVMRQLAAWTDHPALGSVPVGINVSGRHLDSEQFVPHLLELFAVHEVDPGRVVIEVTETVLLDDLSTAAAKLQELRDTGIKVAIDDFGTGYSSLAHLHTLPVDILKVDRSFTARAVADHHNASVVKLIIDTGHLVGVRITVEGIETADQAEKLADLGSDHLQGFFYGTPQSPDQLETATAELT
jgi:diguanylate cyclase (GGDEF)-like protein